MKDTFYLVMNRRGVVKMTKSLVNVHQGEAIAKFNITMPESAFRPPVVERNIVVEDWRDGADLEDIEFRRDIITEAEAEVIKDRRLAKMRVILEQQGYKIIHPDDLDDEPPGGNDPELQ